jgi:hypothetical protein
VAFILFGFGAITYARHPEGSIEAQTARAVNAIVRQVGHRSGDPGTDDPGRPDPKSGRPGAGNGKSPGPTDHGSMGRTEAKASGPPFADLSDSPRRAAAPVQPGDGGGTA